MGKLSVFLDKCTNIKDGDIVGTTDPYVRFELEQDNWVKDVDYGFQTSSRKENDLNPCYGEEFTWNIPTIDNMVLTVKIMDEDTMSSDDKVGKCKINLEKADLTSDYQDFEKVVDRSLFKGNGKVFLKIKYEE